MTTTGTIIPGSNVTDMPVRTMLLVAEKTGQLPAEAWEPSHSCPRSQSGEHPPRYISFAYGLIISSATFSPMLGI